MLDMERMPAHVAIIMDGNGRWATRHNVSRLTGHNAGMKLAIKASEAGGSYPVAMNAANEVLVAAFLDKKIGFTDIQDGIERILDEHVSTGTPELDDIIAIDRETREKVEREIIC